MGEAQKHPFPGGAGALLSCQGSRRLRKKGIEVRISCTTQNT